jgi:serine/threonine protein phosphatase 1
MDMERIFIIGDIHGCHKTFRKLIYEEISIKESDRIYCLGDYIDRGSNSRGVVDFILELRKDNYQVYTLRGNHEQMLLDSENSISANALWKMNGGNTTLRDFKVSTIRELDPVYLEFFESTEFYFKTDQFLLVHAGLNFNLPDPLADKYSLLWIRDFKVNKSYLGGRILVHGHTPVNGDFIRRQYFESPFNIDGGCVYKDIEGLGSLFALNFFEQKLVEVRNIDE